MAKKEEEHSIFEKWRDTQHPKHFQELYKSMKPLLYDAAKKASFGSNLPESVHRAWAAQNFLDALRTFTPGGGAALQTHVYNAVHQKAKRLNYMFQNLGHIPEPRAMQVGLYQTEYQNMRDQLGREPSAAELADRLSWNIKEVSSIQKEIRKEFGLTEGVEETPFFESSTDEEILDYLYFELSPEEQVVYDYVFGKHGKPKLKKASNKIDFEAIAGKVGFSSSKVRSLVIKIREKLKKALER